MPAKNEQMTMTCNLLINISTCELALLVYLKCVFYLKPSLKSSLILRRKSTQQTGFKNRNREHELNLDFFFLFPYWLRCFTEILISLKHSTWGASKNRPMHFNKSALNHLCICVCVFISEDFRLKTALIKLTRIIFAERSSP